MLSRIPLVTGLLACLAMAAHAPAQASERDAIIAGSVLGAVVGGVIASSPRVEVYPAPAPYPAYYEPRPVYPPVYYEPAYYPPAPAYYGPPPVAMRPVFVEGGPRHHHRHWHHREYYPDGRW